MSLRDWLRKKPTRTSTTTSSTPHLEPSPRPAQHTRLDPYTPTAFDSGHSTPSPGCSSTSSASDSSSSSSSSTSCGGDS